MAGKSVLVAGATGQQGGAVARELLACGYEVRAMTRKTNSHAARALAEAGAEIVKGDLDDAASVSAALEHVWGAFAVQNTWEAGVHGEERQGKQFAELARKAGVQHYVYTSVGSADRETGVPHFENKIRIEQTVRELDFPSFVILRPVFFMENMKKFFAPDASGNLYVAMSPNRKLQMIAVQDIGKYGHLAFDEASKLNGQAIDIAGDELSMAEAARVISQATGKTVNHVEANIEDVRAYSADMALMFEWFESTGYNVNIAANEKEHGIKPTSFKDWAKSAY